MSYFAVAATRVDGTWEAAEVDLDGVDDLDEVVDRLREVDAGADTSLLFVEADDEYLVIMRLDEGDDLRVFGSDAPFADESRLGAILLSDTDTEPVEAVDEDDPDMPVKSELDVEPVGDSDLLADLGVTAAYLLTLCAKDGMLPSDVTAEVASRIGCGDVMEEVHDA
ncbi:putative tRNA adenosine deaminase-associated protein [Stackebrandtia endophytica]|uniref:Putative tRNA adenosine deaminase-associated protein n=1 Tax=Stackebrandtia endophytica TaxID=1496996 RepID=A0A543AYM5_9ACTN|nr:tRNA adenosine deaminase-associated protein [Stackebrandtia endophytica]TQL77674.1 putative tRNA adenosine deaminase-associated protein [Stackebrandtia endophytica]